MSSFQQQFPWPSQRMPAMARNMVATSQPLAAQAGLQAIKRGGNAVDAALATAITLAVVEPTMNGIGSDAFCMIHDGSQLHGLNASGRSPMALDARDFRGLQEMPMTGWDSVTVPGAVSAWVELSEKFGSLSFESLFEDAIHYADHGFQVTPITARLWSFAPREFADFPDFAPFLPQGRPPQAGDLFRFPDQARTLEKIALSKGEAFYRGELARRIVAASRRDGGKFTQADLERHQCDWIEPISHPWHGYDLHEIPPNGQGLAALIMLGILSHSPIAEYEVDSIDALHCQIEAMKLAFADTRRYVADPDFIDRTALDLLDDDYLASRATMINMRRAQDPGYGAPPGSGTVYLATADQSGMMVSYIQSNYCGFGSGIVIPGTGISLQNRGAGFSLEEGRPNQVAGGKRPFHTIIPAFLTRNGLPVMSFGVMGGHMQAQGHAQIIQRVCNQGMNPQAASDAPRWQVSEEKQVLLEYGYDRRIRDGLRERGHDIPDFDSEQIFSMGGAQLIRKTEHGYEGGSDHRKDGIAIGF